MIYSRFTNDFPEKCAKQVSARDLFRSRPPFKKKFIQSFISLSAPSVSVACARALKSANSRRRDQDSSSRGGLLHAWCWRIKAANRERERSTDDLFENTHAYTTKAFCSNTALPLSLCSSLFFFYPSVVFRIAFSTPA